MALSQLSNSDLLLINRGPQSYKITIDDFSSEIGLDLATGNLVVDNDLTVNGNAIIGDSTKLCADTLNIFNATNIACTLVVGGAGTFESTLEVQDLATFKNSADVQGNLTVTQDGFVGGGTKTAGVAVIGTSLVMSSVSLSDNSVIPSSYQGKPYRFGVGGTDANPVEIEASAGNAYFKGEVHASFFEGDGSRLVNLNLPGSLNFKGVINAVKDDAPTSPAPAFGDYYLNSDPVAGDADGNPKSGQWGTLGAVVEGDFIYYAEVTPNLGDWVKASGSDSAYVTIAGLQTISGAKIFSENIRAVKGIDATGALVDTNDLRFVNGVGLNLDLALKATSASTTGLDADETLVTKDYVDFGDQNAKTEFDLVAGDHLLDASGAYDARFNGSAEVTLNVDAEAAPTPDKIVLRDGSGNITAKDVNAVEGNVQVVGGSILVVASTTGILNGKGKITCPNDIETDTSVISNKVETNQVDALTYNLDMLASISTAPITP